MLHTNPDRAIPTSGSFLRRTGSAAAAKLPIATPIRSVNTYSGRHQTRVYLRALISMRLTSAFFSKPQVRIMSCDARPSSSKEPSLQGSLPLHDGPSSPRMQYRSRPVTVAVDPISLVISECISITSAVQKHARSPHSSVSAILGGNPNPIHLGPLSPGLRDRRTASTDGTGNTDGAADVVNANRWGLRGQKGKSMQDNPLISGFGTLRHEIAGIKG